MEGLMALVDPGVFVLPEELSKNPVIWCRNGKAQPGDGIHGFSILPLGYQASDIDFLHLTSLP
jgi:hypothetical protein